MDKNWRTEYERILNAATEIALATSVGGVPNVRIVNFCQDPKCPGAIYFSTDRSNDKVAEFASKSSDCGCPRYQPSRRASTERCGL